MLTFEPITPQSAPRMRPYYADCSYHLCEYSVGVKLMWGEYLYPSFTEAAGCLIIRNELHGETLFDFPVPGEDGDVDAALTAIEDYCTQKGIAPVISVVPEQEAGRLALRYPRVHIVNERAWKDYLYRAEDLSTFAGRRYSGQRNHISRFLRTCQSWSFEPLDSTDAAEVEAFFHTLNKKLNYAPGEAAEENHKVQEVLEHLDQYGLVGGVLRADGAIVGFTLGEVLRDTLYIHIEKADRDYPGAYQMLCRQFCTAYAGDLAYVNREEDMGDLGLRKAKRDLHPVTQLKKYTVEVW